MFCLLCIKVKMLCPWMPLMKISLELLELIAFLTALHISALERWYLNSLYSIHRFIGMIVRNEYVISVILFYINSRRKHIKSSPCLILHQDNVLL